MTANEVPADPHHEAPIDPVTGYPDHSAAMGEPQPLDPPSAGRHSLPKIEIVDVVHDVTADAGPVSYAPVASPATAFAEPVTDAAPSMLSEAAFHRFAQGMHDQFSQVHASLQANFSNLERSYEESLSHLRTRAEEAETSVSSDLLRPLAQRFAMMIDRLELSIDREKDDPWLLTKTVVEETIDILEEFGIETIPCEPGTEVNRSQHRVVKMLNDRTTPDDAQRVVERRRHGMVIDGYVVRPAEVIAQWVPMTVDASQAAET